MLDKRRNLVCDNPQIFYSMFVVPRCLGFSVSCHSKKFRFRRKAVSTALPSWKWASREHRRESRVANGALACRRGNCDTRWSEMAFVGEALSSSKSARVWHYPGPVIGSVWLPPTGDNFRHSMHPWRYCDRHDPGSPERLTRTCADNQNAEVSSERLRSEWKRLTAIARVTLKVTASYRQRAKGDSGRIKSGCLGAFRANISQHACCFPAIMKYWRIYETQ